MAGPIFSTRDADFLNTGDKLSFTVPLMNTGDALATKVIVTDVVVGTAIRSAPTAYPIVAGDCGVNNVISVNASFATNRLVVGSRYQLSIRGTYIYAAKTYGFNVNRFIVVPPVSTSPLGMLAGRVQVAASSGIWNYTVYNDEVFSTARYINSFALDVAAPIKSTKTPSGWAVLTDNATYVFWYATTESAQIRPGTMLAGFQVVSSSLKSETRGYSATSWNRTNQAADLVLMGDVIVPSNRV